MTENMMKFLEEAGKDAAFAEKVNSADSIETVIALAKEKGFELSEADLQFELPGAELPTGELDDDALEGVAGGMMVGSMAAGSMSAGSMAAGSMAAGSMAAGAMAAGAVAAGAVAAGSVAAGSVAAGSVAAGSVAAGALKQFPGLTSLVFKTSMKPTLQKLPMSGSTGGVVLL